MMYALLMTFYFVVKGLNAFFIKKAQTQENTLKGAMIFTTLFSFFQLVTLWILPPYELKAIPLDFYIWPLCYAVLFILAFVLFIKAMSVGSTGVSNAVFSFYIVVPILVGIVCWNESVTFMKVAGLLLFGAAVFLFQMTPSSRMKASHKWQSKQWLVFIILATLFSGISVIFTKECLLRYPGYDKEYLLVFNLFVVLIGLPLIIKEWKSIKQTYGNKGFMLNTLGAAITQNLNNLIFILYLNKVDGIIFLPMIGVLNILSVILMGRVMLKEQFTRNIYIATAVSIISLFILNL